MTMKIAHISDLHVGSSRFMADKLRTTIREINDMDLVVISGDVTEDGYQQEYAELKEYLDLLRPDYVVVPGNHDARNIGYLSFEESFGTLTPERRIDGLLIVGLDSSEPDSNEGHIGRFRHRWLEEKLAKFEGVKIITLHHHLLPVPMTGRERNVLWDAGDFLEVLSRCGVSLALCGHKHVPHVWRLEDMIILNAGTASSRALKHTTQCYNIIEIDDKKITIYLKDVGGKKREIKTLSL